MDRTWNCHDCPGDYALALPRSDRDRLGLDTTDLESLLRPRLAARGKVARRNHYVTKIHHLTHDIAGV